MVLWIIFLVTSSFFTDTSQTGSILEGYCGIYNGKVCKKYLTGIGQVWFHNTSDNPGGWLNERITTDLWETLIQKLKDPCRSAAEHDVKHLLYGSILVLMTEAVRFTSL